MCAINLLPYSFADPRDGKVHWCERNLPWCLSSEVPGGYHMWHLVVDPDSQRLLRLHAHV